MPPGRAAPPPGVPRVDVEPSKASGTLSVVMSEDRTDWAAMHYRVERDSSGLSASKRKLKKIAAEAAKHGEAAPEESHDVVRIVDRDGEVVMERDWGRNRQAAMEEEARIVEDLLHLDVVRFRARYAIGFEAPPAEAGVDRTWADLPPAQGTTDVHETGGEGKPEGAPG